MSCFLLVNSINCSNNNNDNKCRNENCSHCVSCVSFLLVTVLTTWLVVDLGYRNGYIILILVGITTIYPNL